MTACRSVIADLWSEDEKGRPEPLKGAAHAGLVGARYLKYPVKDKDKHPGHRRALLITMQEAQKETARLYTAAFDRYKASHVAPCVSAEFQTKNRLIIGLGNENVLETGITLHHTYGTPIIPGTALKGLTAHYCDRVCCVQGDDQFRKGGDYYTAIFGTSDDSGHFIFHDAWITPETLVNGSGLLLDVMTPHHGEYYSAENEDPTDFDEPNPITFLSVSGTFHVAVSCDVAGEEGEKWTAFVFKILTHALGEWGVGGKTSAGYGKLVPKVVIPPDAASKPGYPANEPRYNKGQTIQVTRAEDPRGKGRLYFVADDGVGGFIKSERLANTPIGGRVSLRIKGIQIPPSYEFEDPEQTSPQPKEGSEKGRKR